MFVILYGFFLAVLRSEKEFHDAAKRNDTDKMQELIGRGMDVKVKNKVRYSQYKPMDTTQSYGWHRDVNILFYMNFLLNVYII